MTKRLFLFFFLLVLIFSACGPVTLPAQPTVIVLPTVTASLSPSITPSQTLTPTITPLQTLTPVNTSVVPYIPSDPEFRDTATPIATPGKTARDYKLRPVNEEVNLALLRLMDQYARGDDIPGVFGARFNFQFDQVYLRLALDEVLFRYPDSRHREDYLWRLAFARAIDGPTEPNEWLVAQIEDALNRQGYTPASINDYLKPHGFVTYGSGGRSNDDKPNQPILNVFGDQKPAWVYQVLTTESVISDGLFVAVRVIAPDRYKVYPLVSAWNFNAGDSYRLEEIGDHNGNGLPEIGLYLGMHSGNSCSGHAAIYEWNGEGFADLSQGKIQTRGCGYEWRFSGNDVIAPNEMPSFRDVIYRWNGSSYDFAGFLKAAPEDAWAYSFDGYNVAFRAEDEALLLEQILAGKTTKVFSPDYLRFRLGFVYALQSKTGQARAEFEKLASLPAAERQTIFPRLAEKLLAKYQGDDSLYGVCAEFQKAVAGYEDPDSTIWQKDFGLKVVDGWLWLNSMPCQSQAVFPLLARSLPTAEIEKLPNLLQQKGVKLQQSTFLDFNMDGQKEWLLVENNTWWLVDVENGSYRATSIQSPRLWDGDLPAPKSIETAHWPGIAYPVIVFRFPSILYVISVDENLNVTVLLDEDGVQEAQLDTSSRPVKIQVAYRAPKPDAWYAGSPWRGFRWDEASLSFQSDLLEHTLFIERNPQAALQLAQQAIKAAKGWDFSGDYVLPEHLYTLALAYELSGDETAAVQTYWQLWHDFPESPYALMAQFKLEPIP